MLNPLSNFSGIISTWFALDLYTGASLKTPSTDVETLFDGIGSVTYWERG